MINRHIASADLRVSPLGLGTVKFGRNQQVHYPKGFDLPSDAEILNLLACARDCGINLLDTAPAYGTSEERLGSLLKGERDQWIISTKVGEEFVAGASVFDFSKTATQKSIERSLKRLNTDYLDVVLVHSSGEDKKIIEDYAIFSTLADLKQVGLIRAYGMSTKTVEGGLMAVAMSDVVMVTHNPAHVEEQVVIAAAHEQGKGIFIKKGLASGHLSKLPGNDPIKEAFRFIFTEPGVTSVIVGTLNPVHLKHNVDCVSSVIKGIS